MPCHLTEKLLLPMMSRDVPKFCFFFLLHHVGEARPKKLSIEELVLLGHVKFDTLRSFRWCRVCSSQIIL